MRTLKAISAESLKLHNNISDITALICDKALEAFTRLEGCDTCRGRGWIVTWDTMDCIRGSYAEYGDCPEVVCTAESRTKSGLKPSNTQYDYNQNTVWSMTDSACQLDLAIHTKLTEQTKALDKEYLDVQTFNNPSKGKLVEVIKKARTRNAADVGVIGKVIWTGHNSYGTQKVGLVDKLGDKHWTTEKSVKVLAVESGKDYEEKHEDQFPLLCKAEKNRVNALFVRAMNDTFGAWIPKSQILNMDQVNTQLENGNAITILLPVWLAKKKGYLNS